MSADRFEARIEKVRRALREVDALLVTSLPNVRYLTGFSGTNAQLLVSERAAVFFSDPRYAARAGDLVEGAEVCIYPSRLTERLPERMRGIARLGIEATAMTVAARADLVKALGDVEVVSTRGIVEGLRRSKDDEEIDLIRQAIALGDEVFDWVLGRLRPGRTEREIALDLEVRLRSRGAEAVSFEPIVGSGPLSAHIHHTPGERALHAGDLVLLDFGARVDGYCSDLTRTVVLGTASERHKEVYERVLEAQQTGIDALRAEASAAEVDGAGRALIEQGGDALLHGLGHGVGLEIHEAPRLHRDSEDSLVAGEVVTVEPGVYREGWGGIRIEDCVLVTTDGAEVLSGAPKKELIEAR